MDNLSYFTQLQERLERHEAIWQACIVATEGSSPAKAGMKLAIPLSGEPFGNLGGGELEHSVIMMVKTQQPSSSQVYDFSLAADGSTASLSTGMICGGRVQVFIEALHHVHKLYIIGAGHCGKALGHLARLCGYYVCLVDNRAEIINSDLSEYAHEAILSNYDNLAEAIRFGRESSVVIMTHGHLHDKEVLQQCLRQESGYLGMIGSKSKVASTFEKLMEQGFTREELSKCHAPIGLAIGSQSPYEIAVSIVAELISLRSSSASRD